MRTPAAWLRRCKRRTPGVYAYRTRRHNSTWRTQWGYVGETWHLKGRDECHRGVCGRHRGCVEKPWMDLVVYRWTLPLPWWLGWKWVIRSIETILIILLRPQYNQAKNRRRSRTPLSVQHLQRAARERGGAPVYARPPALHALAASRIAAVMMIVIGIGGWLLCAR